MGGSIAAAIKARGLAAQVVAFDQSSAELAIGLEMGLIDEAAGSVAAATEQADLVMMAVPVLALEAVLVALAGSVSGDAYAKSGTTVDAGMSAGDKGVVANAGVSSGAGAAGPAGRPWGI